MANGLHVVNTDGKKQRRKTSAFEHWCEWLQLVISTPDFLVICTDGACFEEWKPEHKLLELMVTHPRRYQRDAQGHWRCPPGEAAAEREGLSYRVRSWKELHSAYIRNLLFIRGLLYGLGSPLGLETRDRSVTHGTRRASGCHELHCRRRRHGLRPIQVAI